MEFQIKTDLSIIPQEIEFNFEEMKAELSERLGHYNALVVTEDSIKEAKADKAKLNKLRTAIEDKRKEIKKLCLVPYEKFEKNCKEVVALIDEPIKSIDGQISVFDQKMQEEKWFRIMEFYMAEVKELLNIVTLESIISPKWKNKTESYESICNAVGDTLDRIRTDLETIKSLNSPYENQMRDVYLNGGYNLSKAMQEHKRIEERNRQLAEMEARKAEASKVKPAEVPTPVPEPVEIAQTPEPVSKPEPKYKVNFSVTGDKVQIIALKEFMTRNNINYEVIK